MATTPTQDVTAIPASTPSSGALIQGILNGLFVNFTALTHLLSASERDALNRPVDGEPLGSDNRIISAAELASAMSEAAALLAAHTDRTDNPHAVTAAQVGLGNCDNTSDVNKPVSTAQAASLADHAANTGDAKHVTAAILAALSVYMGPGSEPSESNPYATMWTLWRQIVTAAGWLELDDETDGDPFTVSGYTPEWIGQVCRNTTTATIWVGTATAGDAADWSRLETLLSGLTISQITGLADALAAEATALAAHIADTANPHAVSAAQVGLGNCDNTSDADKPVSTAQAAAIAAESSARLAADLALLASQPTISAITYKGGMSAFAASAARVGWLDYGGAVMLRVCALGAGTLADMAPLVVAIYDSDGTAARVQVSLTLDTGTLVMQTTARALPLSAWRRLGVRVDAPSGGTLSSASVAVHIEGETYTLANGGLDVVGTAYTGAPAAGTGAWTLCADSAGANTLACRVASDGWHALNYPLSPSQWLDWIATGFLPYEGSGTMQYDLPNRSFDTFTGTADDGITDSFFLWTSTLASGAIIEAVTSPSGYAAKIDAGPTPSDSTKMYSFKINRPNNRIVIRTTSRGDGTNQGRLWLYAGSGMYWNDIGGTRTTYLSSSTEWTTTDVTFDVSGAAYVMYLAPTEVNGVTTIDNVEVIVLGDLLAGMNFSAQPVCTRTAGGEVLLHSESGVDLPDLPERMVLASQLPMSAAGYLLGDRLTHPAGYVVDKVLVTNTGSASATVTLRAGSSGGAAMATGTVAATGLPVALPLSSLSGLTVSGGKVYVTGGAATSPLAITVILARA